VRSRVGPSSTVSLAAVPNLAFRASAVLSACQHYDDRVGIVSFGYEHPRRPAAREAECRRHGEPRLDPHHPALRSPRRDEMSLDEVERISI
jgi:hypothetical protein